MDVDLVFKIAAIGILVAVAQYPALARGAASGACIATIAGLVVVAGAE